MKTNPFAGLMAGFRGARAENDQPDDEEARKARRAEEDKVREEEDARRAEEDERRQEEDARRAEEDGGNDPEEPDPADEKGKKGKRGKKAEDGDQDPEDDAGDDHADAEEGMNEDEAKAYQRGLAEGRRRENVRATRIFSSPSAAGRADLAATLAFTTRNSSAEADRLMKAAGNAPPQRGRSLDDRMGSRTDARPGPNGGRGKPATLGQRIIAATKKARGEA